MEELRKKIALLSKPIWNIKDVGDYFGVCRNTAKQMLEQSIIKANGAIYGFENKVKSESVITLYCGHTKKEEMEILCAGAKYEESI